jgi:hypothetical protein
MIADQYRIRPGDEIVFEEAGEYIRVSPERRRRAQRSSADERLEWFDRATERQRAREQAATAPASAAERGWTRDDLYRRGGAD